MPSLKITMSAAASRCTRVACAAMVAVLLALQGALPAFTGMDKWQRAGWLAVLVCGGGATYVVALLALGFRPRDLRDR